MNDMTVHAERTPEPNFTPQQKRTLELLRPILGVWAGRGEGKFPTIDSFSYDESLEFSLRSREDNFIRYYQDTLELIPGRLETKPGHTETGFIFVHVDGSLTLSNIQTASGRHEEMAGEVIEVGDGTIVIKFTSRSFSGDDRMKATKRIFKLDGDLFSYEMSMATQKTPELQTHLEASLQKIIGEENE